MISGPRSYDILLEMSKIGLLGPTFHSQLPLMKFLALHVFLEEGIDVNTIMVDKLLLEYNI